MTPPSLSFDFPPPNTLGLPARYSTWRPAQLDFLTRFLDSDRRVGAAVLPTGAGKSLLAVAYALLDGSPTAYLTATKGLQDQAQEDFEADVEGYLDMRGANAYRCLESEPGGTFSQYYKTPIGCDEGRCRVGWSCDLKPVRNRETGEWEGGGCLYYDRVKGSPGYPLVVTNYAFWLAVNQYGTGIGPRDLLILDEAHHAPEQLSKALTLSLTERQVTQASLPWVDTEDPTQWASWARSHVEALKRHVEEYVGKTSPLSPREQVQLGQTLTTVKEMMQVDRNWVGDQKELGRGRGKVRAIDLTPLDVAAFAEQHLFRGAKKILLLSATIRPKTVELLGLKMKDTVFHEVASSFPVERRPVYLTDGVRMDKRATPAHYDAWLQGIDQIIRRRLDRKGVVHSTSYARQDYIVRHSKHRGFMIAPERGKIAEAVERFKAAEPPCVLVSPSVTTGYDFPMTEAEFQIIGKVPFPDSRDKVTKARQDRDKEYGPYLAYQQLVQAAGRGMRSEEDSCEVFIVDTHARWFVWKHKDLAPQWFLDAVTQTDLLPQPLSKLGTEDDDLPF